LEKFDDLTDGFSDIWKKSSTYSIPLSRLWQSENANYQMMGVQAIYNDEYVAVKLEWKDPTIDQGISRIQDFQDGAAIQFSLDGSKGFHGMGSKDHPTDIWFWKAEWQKRIDTNMESDITLAYANRVSDSDIKQFPSVMNDVAYLAGRDAGNLNAYTTQLSSIENARATGPETITPFHKDDQEVFGKGIWDGGKWRVVFVRKRRPSLIEKVNFNKNKSIPIGFAVWNGSEQDRNGQKMVSTWYDLELKD